MGHTRLGQLPKTREWQEIASLFGEQLDFRPLTSEEIEVIVSKTLSATTESLKKATKDPGFLHAFYCLTQIALASREDSWDSRLSVLGLRVDRATNIFELTVEMQSAIDVHLRDKGHSSDLSEIAQQAAGDALLRLATSSSGSLFGDQTQDLQRLVHSASTKSGFSELGQSFFSSFMARFLNFYLSRATAAKVGSGRLKRVSDVSKFNEALTLHCRQTARIVRDFCGEWYSKTEFTSGIDKSNSARFTAVALKKLQAELERQRGPRD